MTTAWLTTTDEEDALLALRRAVGDPNVWSDEDALARAGVATIPRPRRPRFVVAPASSDEVARVLRVAREHGLHVWPASAGKNWGYGSATAARDGAVQLRLHRMRRIVEVDESLAFAVVEPGVTYRQLRAHLEQHHPHLWSDCTDGPPGGSIVGNAMDRGLGVTHYSDHFGTICGLEVVLPDGTTMHTGGGPRGCKTFHTHKWGVGPYAEGLFSQGNFGVVTKAGVWLMPRPESFASFTCDVHETARLPALVDALRGLALDGVLQSASHIVNDVVSLAVLDQYPAELVGRVSRLSDGTLASLRRRHGIPAWSFGGGLQGPRGVVRAMKREVRRRLAPIGRVLFLDDAGVRAVARVRRAMDAPRLGGLVEAAVSRVTGKGRTMLDVAPHVHALLKGVPSDFFVRHAYLKSRVRKPEVADPDRDGVGLTWFAPIVPMTGAHVDDVLRTMRPLFEKYEFDFYAALLVQNPRSMVVLTSIFFDKESAAETERAEALYQELADATHRAGYQQYRVGVNGMERLARESSSQTRFLRTLKRAIDPEGTLAPGKYGL